MSDWIESVEENLLEARALDPGDRDGGRQRPRQVALDPNEVAAKIGKRLNIASLRDNDCFDRGATPVHECNQVAFAGVQLEPAGP